MKFLDNISSSNIIAIDIETVRISDTFESLPADFQSAWEYKNKQDGKVPDYEVLEEMWVKNSSLYAEFSKVCAVSIVFLSSDNSKVMCKEFFGIDEKEILTALKVYLDRIYTKNKSNKLLAHAGKYFDYPFLSKRYVINEIDVPELLDVLHLKPWEAVNLLDSNDIWKMGGTGAGSSLQALCTCLGVPTSKNDLVGDAVGKAYYNGELKRIGRYCSEDSLATFNVFRRLKKEKIFTLDELAFVEESSKIQDEISILNKLILKGEISAEEKKELKKAVKPYLKTSEFKLIMKMINEVVPNFKL